MEVSQTGLSRVSAFKTICAVTGRRILMMTVMLERGVLPGFLGMSWSTVMWASHVFPSLRCGYRRSEVLSA